MDDGRLCSICCSLLKGMRLSHSVGLSRPRRCRLYLRAALLKPNRAVDGAASRVWLRWSRSHTLRAAGSRLITAWALGVGVTSSCLLLPLLLLPLLLLPLLLLPLLLLLVVVVVVVVVVVQLRAASCTWYWEYGAAHFTPFPVLCAVCCAWAWAPVPPAPHAAAARSAPSRPASS
jgi:hypothetical protein